MFQVVSRHLELVFFLLTIPKCDLCEVEKAMFQRLLSHFEIIFGLLTIPIYELVEVQKAMFERLAGPLKIFSPSGLARNGNWMSKKRNFSGCKALRTHFLPLDQLKKRFV